MGAACCVAAKDQSIISASPCNTLQSQRHSRYSPSWSFRWDNRGRVAGEETSANWLHDGGGGNDRMEVKFSSTGGTAFASEASSPLGSNRSLAWQKSPASERNAGIFRVQSSSKSPHDQTNSQNAVEIKELIESPSVSHRSPVKSTPRFPSVSSISTSPQSSQSHSLPPRWHRRSPGHHLSRQVSDIRFSEYKSPTFSISEESPSFLPSIWANESNRGSNDGSSDTWSIPAFTELLTRRERWSFDSEASGFSREKITSGPISRSLSFDLPTCTICLKLLTERSSIYANELAVVSVLTCGHFYHAECLENMTSEINKYDPVCPVCTFGEEWIAKMSVKAELDAMAKKKSKKCIMDSEILFNRLKSSGIDGKSPKMSASSSLKISLGKPRRHFSFGSKNSRSLSQNLSTQKKGFFWAKSSKAEPALQI